MSWDFLFKWTAAGPVTLYGFLLHYPLQFLGTVLVAFVFAMLLFEEVEEGSRKFGYRLLTTYFVTLIIWFIAAWVWHL